MATSTTRTTPARTRAAKTTGPASDGSFQWTTPGGVKVEVPSMASMDPPMGAVEDLAADSGSPNPMVALGAQIRFLGHVLPDNVMVELRKLRAREFLEFMREWSAHSGVTLGESQAS